MHNIPKPQKQTLTQEDEMNRENLKRVMFEKKTR